MLDFLSYTFAEAYKHLTEIKFDKGSPLHRTIVSLYATIIEQTQDAMVLHRSGQHVTLDIILRATLEAFVDIENLCRDDTYLNHMKASFHEQWIKLAQHGVAGGNPFLQGFTNNPEAASLLAQHRVDLDALSLTPPLNVYERFRRAGMEDIYRSVYNSLCNETHNNIRALTNRHLRVEGDNWELVIFDQPQADSLASTLSSFIGILVRSSSIIHDYFQTGAREAIKALSDEHEAFIRSYEETMQQEPALAEKDETGS
ncbi:DUF5677 domain-containing protein [Rhizobium ecuadorense]|uniref:DUF5677 domain-containing protein n=1 Tax=Rhizobium ecuadorense TaxID=1671795 RepID=UPI0006736330|nr:DUF5677 domain-containing protein [Rhizobium ecuadorense]